MSDLAIDNLRVGREGRIVLDVPSLSMRGGRTTAVLGPNGSGKTTLLRVIAGLEASHAGTVRVGGSRSSQSRELAYVFQEDVFLRHSVRYNLELGLRLRRIDETQMRHRIDQAVDLLGIGHLLDRRADRLSGGEGRRVSLARALCLRAPLVLLDEPLAGLDERAYTQLVDELPSILAAFSATTVFVTHRREEALRLADDLIVLIGGRVHAAGDRKAVAADPRTAEVARVLGFAVLGAAGRKVAVRPDALKLGSGPLQFFMTVDGILDVVGPPDVMGRVGDTRVRVPLGVDAVPPLMGARVVVSTDQFVEVE